MPETEIENMDNNRMDKPVQPEAQEQKNGGFFITEAQGVQMQKQEDAEDEMPEVTQSEQSFNDFGRDKMNLFKL